METTNKIKAVLKNVAIGGTIVGILGAVVYGALDGQKRNSVIRQQAQQQSLAAKYGLEHIAANQKIVENGKNPYPYAQDYTILSDIDGDDNYDVAVRTQIGYTTGSFHQTIMYKAGYGPAQSTASCPSYMTFTNGVDPQYFDWAK